MQGYQQVQALGLEFPAAGATGSVFQNLCVFARQRRESFDQLVEAESWHGTAMRPSILQLKCLQRAGRTTQIMPINETFSASCSWRLVRINLQYAMVMACSMPVEGLNPVSIW